MFLGNLDQPGTYQTLLSHGTWTKALKWLREHRERLPEDGEYELDGHDFRAIVQTVNTQPRTKRVFEAHQLEIDLQCCFRGSELIEWAPLNTLQARGEYNTEKDYTLYDVPLSATTLRTTLRMTPGTFAIFFPADGHMPGIKAEHDQTRKVVIKVNTGLLAGKLATLGPFEVTVDYEQREEAIFNTLVANGRFDRVNAEDINHRNFPFSPITRRRVIKEVLLLNFGRSVANDQTPDELAKVGYQSVKSEWVLALNAQYPTLMDEHIIITTDTPWTGREDAPEVICLHKDNNKRRLRTHYADTVWGSHIWFAVERLA
jgi:YhcH/YjgK/YiaL family protein